MFGKIFQHLNKFFLKTTCLQSEYFYTYDSEIFWKIFSNLWETVTMSNKINIDYFMALSF